MHDLRTDHLFITAINDESEYEGGDLIIRWGTENLSFRLKKVRVFWLIQIYGIL